ncbi:SRPBCC family protein [Chitinophaga flava]|uniref:Polyketide cyclase n=1 Tax=Chitinophaga flava TaxID=2259036 RepID=A0A365XX74_9BACT|nr:SRPBCC domain-containing protein [Chitinophaga flava]RBL90668.1 polyketide cyclase [Chitinophaga flava]
MSHTADIPAHFSLVYTFKAPKELVFDAFSNADALNQWWGPAESKNSVVSLDFRPGGIFHFRMEFSNTEVAYGRFLYRTIQPYDLLEFTNAFADEQARVVKPPFEIPFPLEIFYRLEFREENGNTVLTLTGQPVDPEPEEMASFLNINRSMQQGFSATFSKLATYLRK